MQGDGRRGPAEGIFQRALQRDERGGRQGRAEARKPHRVRGELHGRRRRPRQLRLLLHQTQTRGQEGSRDLRRRRAVHSAGFGRPELQRIHDCTSFFHHGHGEGWGQGFLPARRGG